MTTPTPPPPPVPPPPYGGLPPDEGPPGKAPQKIAGIPVTPVTAIIFSVLVLCGVCAGFGALVGEQPDETIQAGDEPAATVAETTTASTVAPPTTEPPPTTPPPPAWPDVPLDMTTVEARLRAEDLEPASVQVNGGIVTARFKPQVWDSNQRVQKAGDLGYAATRAVSGHPGIESVRVELLADGTDRFGNDIEMLAIWSQIDRATFERINWDGLKDRVTIDGSDWLCLADRRGSHAAVRAEVETTRCLT